MCNNCRCLCCPCHMTDGERWRLKQAEAAVDQVNAAWRRLPTGYGLWMDWSRPPKVTIVKIARGQRNMGRVYP